MAELNERDEVKSLLSRHKSRIESELLDANLIDLLVKKSVITSSEENLLKTTSGNENNDNDNHDTNENDSKSFENHSEQCIKLIDLIAENGFEKFKNFCFAIENECPRLIEDLINDKLKKDLVEEKDNTKNEKPNDKDKLDSESNINSSTSSPIVLSSYESPTNSSIQQKFTNSQSQSSSPSNINQIVQNVHRNESLSTSNNNYTSSLRQKLFHRFSDAATLGKRLKKKKNSDRSCYSMSDTIELFAEPVIEDDGERSSWEYHTVSVTRVPGYGFGIAVSGGRDNPHFANGDPSIAVSDVLKGGPAEDRLQVNDRIVSVNGVSLENVEYATAVQVLRDSGNTVTLVVKRRVINPATTILPHHQHPQLISNTGNISSNNPAVTTINPTGLQTTHNQGQPIRVTLTKSSKKEDFGIVLGCRLFIKEISSKTRDQLLANGYSLNEGDIITRIHNTNCNDSMSLKEAKKIIDGCKERLNLVVLRDITNQCVTNVTNNLNNLGVSSPTVNTYSHPQQVLACNNNLDEPYRYSSQNLYVQPPTRGGGGGGGAGNISSPPLNDEKSNLTPRGRSRGPLMDVSLTQLDRPSTPLNENTILRRSDEPPRPPPPRGEDFYSSCRRQLYDDDPLHHRSRHSAEPRFISFQKEGSVGIRLTGGNEAGIFVTAVQPGSPASLQGLTPGDKILKVNDMDMHGVTREEAVLFLLSLQDRIDLIVQHCKDEYDEVVANQRGDSFHIKTHFHCDNPSKGEMAFKAGDVFRVIDTLHNGVVGSWQVLKIGRGHQEMQRGVIPNKSRAEELATAQFNATKKELNTSESRGNFFRRRRTHRRSKSLSKENWDDVVFSDSISKFPAYERVVLRHPGFVRPVVLFGPVSDIAREKLTKDFPDKFTVPLQDDDKSGSSGKSIIVRLSNIRDIMDRGKHALLDITPNAVDRLNYAQFYPIVIFLKADSKHVIKQLRHGLPKSIHKSSKKLFEQQNRIEKVWSHIFSTTIILNETDVWYRKLREAIDLQQSGAVWMSESKPVESLSDDFLFPMTTSRLSYASSPESDLELSPGPSTSLSLGNLPQLVKSSSDPSIATNQDNADRDRDIIGEGLPPPYTHHFDHSNSATRLSNTTLIENKYNFVTNNQNQNQSSTTQDGNLLTTTIAPRISSLYNMNPPDLPPRIDRASKPLIPTSTINNQTNNHNTNNITSGNGSGTGNRSSSTQENLYGKQIGNDSSSDYFTGRHNTDSIERTQNSLERQGISTTSAGTPNKTTSVVHPTQNGGYDSVSSYESYNTTQLSVQNIRLGPNAPDDLKSVPTATARHLPSSATVTNTCDYRSPHEHNLRGFSGINDLNVQNSPGRPSIHDIHTNRNIDVRNSSNLQQGMNVPPHRPTNLSLEKNILETKTDYGKYSRSNSASQADYSKSMKTHSIPPPSNLNMMNGSGGNVVPFKPVPPPKPKNYRPPIQGGQINSSSWDNGEQSPRSPNGFLYPQIPPHYHHSQQTTNSGSPHSAITSGNNGLQNYNFSSPSSSGHISHPPPPPSSNGYKNNQHYNSPYVHRGHTSLSNLPIHSPERQALDLAGSREQRGSAFELYRKPQVGNIGHHHNVREMESDEQFYHQQCWQLNEIHRMPQQSLPSSSQMNEYDYHLQQQQHRQRQYYHQFYDIPPPLPLPKKEKKKLSVLKNPLNAFKNVFMKTTRPLRRMSSMVEPERKIKPCLRRQHSMMEHKTSSRYPYIKTDNFSQRSSPLFSLPSSELHYNIHSNHESFYSEALNSTYRNMESEDIYRSNRSSNFKRQEDFDDLYANRALIDLERRQAGRRRIVRRHSMAEKPISSQYPTIYHTQQKEYESYENSNSSYQNYENSRSIMNEKRAPGSEIMIRRRFNSSSSDTSIEPIYKSRMEMHRIHLYQSRKEMQERIAQGKREIEREFCSQHNDTKSINIIKNNRDFPDDQESIYKTKKDLKENEFRIKSPIQFEDRTYQTRKEVMEPIYVSRKSMMRHEPIYETREECLTLSKENITDEKKEENNVNSSSADDTLTTSDSRPSNETIIENYKIETTKDTVSSSNSNSNSVEVYKTPYHISSIIKRTASVLPPDNINASSTSIETHYTSSQINLPNATSTPYASDNFLPKSSTTDTAAVTSANTVVESLIKKNSPIKETTTTKGIFDENGGTLVDNVWNVSLYIPPGAIASGVKQEIYFTVSDPRISQTVRGPPLDMENGETMLSPLVMCGPQGLEFLVPVTLNIPHCAGRTTSLGLSLKATDSEKSLQTNWDNIDLPSNTAAHTVSVKVDHF